MANFLDDLSVYNAKAALVISQVVANGDTGKANMMSSLKSTANDTTLSEAIRLNALTALINLGSLLDVPLPPYFPLTTTYADTQTYVGIHDDLTGIQGGAPGDYQHITTAERSIIANAATLGDITFTNLSGVYTDNANLVNAFAGKQNALSGTGFVKISGTTISYDNSTFLTTISGIASGSAAGGELSGTYPNPALSNAAVISKLLTGFTGVALPTPITSSDTILSAMQKLNNNISSLIVSPSGVASVRLTTNSGGVFTTTTTPQTGASTLDVSLNSQSASRFLASPTSAAGVPTFRAFAVTDLPNSGAIAGTYGSNSFIPQIVVDAKGRITSISSVAAAAGGQVNTVTLTQPGIFGTVTNIGTASAVNLNYGLSQQIANYVWAGPISGANATPAFRALVAADIPNIAISQVTSLSSTLDGFLTDSLSDGSIWIGNTSNAAVQRVLSGDVTVSNTGVTAIGLAKVQYDMIQDVTTQTLLGRYAAVDGEVQQITLLGTDFVLDSGTGVLSLASPVAPVVTTKGDLLGHDLTSQARLPSSNIDGDLLIVDGADSLGLKWVTAQGDVEVDTTLLDGTFNILPGVVTLGKMANLPANRIIGNNTGSSDTPLALTGTQVTAMLDLFSSSTGTKGLVPGSNGNTTYFLRGDLSWQPITGTGTVTAVSITTANGFAGTSSGGATPALTIELNSLNGVLKGTGTAIAAATAGTDFISPGQITQTSGAGSGLTMASGSLLGRTTASAGVIEAIGVNSSLTLASTTLGLNLGNGNIFTVQQQMPSLRLNGATSGFVSFTPPAIAGAQVYELPAAVPTAGTTRFLTSTDGGVLSWQIPAGSGTTTNAATFNNSGSGAASGTTFDGSAARTISYNTIGAQALNANLTGLSALTYTSGSPLIRMTAAGTFTLDGATYVTGTATQYAVLVGGAGNTVASLPAGATTGQLLQYNSGSNNPSWSTVVYPASTTQDRILFSSSNNVIGQIAAPSNNTFLQYASGSYAWTAAVTSLTLSTGITGIVSNSGTATAPILSVSGTLGGLVYFDSATSWDSTGALDQGELIVAGGTSAPVTINNGASGTLLKSNGGANNPSFTSATYPSTTQANRILFSSSDDVVDQIAAPTTASTFLQWNGSSFTWAAAGGGGGSGTVGTGTIGQLAYYTGTTTVGSFSAANSIIYNNNSNIVAALPFGTEANKYLRVNGSGTGLIWDTAGTGTVTSVGLTMPSAFNVSVPNPITTSGTFTVTGAGTISQYIRGDGTLGIFPSIGGGGGGSVYYMNGGVTATPSTIGGVAMKQLSKAPITSGASVDFTANANGATIASFLTDTGDPNQTSIPAGIWVFECYLSAAGGGPAHPTVQAVVETWDGTTLSVIATGVAEEITNGTTKDLYQFAVTIPTGTNISLSDRIVVQIKVVAAASKTITLYTQNGNVSSVTTTFPNGIASLNGLTAATQLFANGSSGTAPAFVSSTATHTLNIPLASSANTVTAGLISYAEYTGKLTNPLTATGDIIYSSSGTTAARLGIGTLNQVLAVSAGGVPEWKTIAAGGDVTGPAGPVIDGNFAVFNSTTGKIIMESAGASLSAAGAAVFNSSVTVGVSGPTGGTTGQLIFRNSANAFTTTIQASTSATASAIYNWPLAQATSAGQILANDGSGNLSWTAAGAGNVTTSGTGQVITGSIFFLSNLQVRDSGQTRNITLAAPTTGGTGAATITFPVLTGTVALLENTQTFTGAKTFGTGAFAVTSAATFSGAVTMDRVGSASNPQLSINAGGGTTNWINFATTGGTAPTTGTRSSGTRFVFSQTVGANSLDYAIGLGGSEVWLSVAGIANSISFYAASGSGGTVVKLGGFTANGLTLDAAGLAANPQLNFNGTGRNWINFAGAGVDSPTNGAAPAGRSSGTRIVFSQTVSASSFDYAIGQGTNEMWFSVSGTSNTFGFWAGTSRIAFFGGGAGVGLTLAGTLVGAASQDVFNTTSTTVNFAGAATALTIGATTGTATIRNAILNLSNASGQLQINGTKVVGTRITGYGTPTGGNRTLSFAATTQAEQVLAQLVADLKTHGLIS